MACRTYIVNLVGPHIVGVIVDTPTKLTKKQKELLEQFKDAKNEDCSLSIFVEKKSCAILKLT